MLKSKFENFVAFLKNKKIVITSHKSVDIDGIASCLVLKFFINQYYNTNDVYLIFPKFTKPTREFCDKFAEKFPEIKFTPKYDIDISQIDAIIILDTNNLDQVKFHNYFNLFNLDIPFIFLDHHLNLKREYSGNLTYLNIIIDEYSSTAEIIFELCEEFDVDLTLPYRYLLIAAILADSGFFRYGNKETIIHVSKLFNEQLDYQEILSTLKIKKDLSEKIAKIKGLQRVQLIQEGDWLIGVTHVGSFEASVASLLTKVGFDVGIVASKKKSEYRISTRAKKEVCLKTGLHLGKILEDITGECDMMVSGGGHDGAASINVKNELETVINRIIDKIKQILNK